MNHGNSGQKDLPLGKRHGVKKLRHYNRLLWLHPQPQTTSLLIEITFGCVKKGYVHISTWLLWPVVSQCVSSASANFTACVLGFYEEQNLLQPLRMNCKVWQYSHVDWNDLCFERERGNWVSKFKAASDINQLSNFINSHTLSSRKIDCTCLYGWESTETLTSLDNQSCLRKCL